MAPEDWKRVGAGYQELRRNFSWNLPLEFNMGVACSDAQVPTKLALVEVDQSGAVGEYTFGEIANLSNRVANGLAGLGIEVGDRVGIVLPQRLETGIAHLALWKLGAISVPLSGLFGPDALRYRLGDCTAKAVITDAASLERVAEVGRDLSELQIIVVDDVADMQHGGHVPFSELAKGSARLEAAHTTPDTPGVLIYTSGTTGPPKGALHGHRVLLGHLPGYDLMFDFFPQAGDRVWTPADWAWIGGLMDALMPAWYHGATVVAARRTGSFDSEWALDLIADHRIKVSFLPPTALKMMRQAGIHRPDVGLRVVMSGGESLGAEMLAWADEHLGVKVNEILGQTEANLIIGCCASAWETKPGSMGRPYPGHDVALIDEGGRAVAAGEVGEIAVRAPDPVMFLEYWKMPKATVEKFMEGPDGARWLRTGDLGRADEGGYLYFVSRNDDVINSAGYRIGPAEIEECLTAHPAVAMAAVIGVPDQLRGQVVKAFVQLVDGNEATPELEGGISAHVRNRLAAYEYPRHIEFVRELPLTTTGKIRRNELRRREEEKLSGEADKG